MMPAAAQRGAAAYRNMAIRTASGGHLVLMLFDGALNALSSAADGFDLADLVARNETISNNLVKAQNILTELQRTLDVERGGDFAMNMYRIYDYMLQRVFDANIGKDRAPIVEVRQLLREIRDAWQQMVFGQEAAG
jgi:flagellar secretion chaperone FliS